jgi:hypothetical protein
MDYTIIGMEANLAARLQSIAEPGQIVVSYETYALVRDIVVAHVLATITMKGISRKSAGGEGVQVFSEHVTGLDFYLNANMIDPCTATHITEVLQNALNALKNRPRPQRRSIGSLGHGNDVDVAFGSTSDVLSTRLALPIRPRLRTYCCTQQTTFRANKRHRGATAANQRRPSFPDCSDQDSFQSGLILLRTYANS